MKNEPDMVDVCPSKPQSGASRDWTRRLLSLDEHLLYYPLFPGGANVVYETFWWPAMSHNNNPKLLFDTAC